MPFYSVTDSQFYSYFRLDTLDLLNQNSQLRQYLDNIQNSKALEELNFGYYTEYEFNNRTRGLRDCVELAVMHLNVRSLNCNHRALCQFMELLALKFDVIILSEIWSTNINFYHNILKGYTFYYELPKETHIGGIGVFISNDFSHLERNEFNTLTARTQGRDGFPRFQDPRVGHFFVKPMGVRHAPFTL